MRVILLLIILSFNLQAKEDLMEKFRQKETKRDLFFKQGTQDLRDDPKYKEYENPLEHQEARPVVAQEAPKVAPEALKTRPQANKETYSMSKEDAEAMGKMMMQGTQGGMPALPGQMSPKNK